jgi:hypothetical protein
MGAGPVANNGTVTAQTTPPPPPAASTASGGIADTSGPGVASLSPVRADPKDAKAQLAAHYSATLGAIFMYPSRVIDGEKLETAARNAVISAFGVNPADPNFDLKKFHPDDADVARVARGLYNNYRRDGDTVDDRGANIDLANALEGFRFDLMDRDRGSFLESYRDARGAEEKNRLRESPEGQRALRNAASWAATPACGEDPEQGAVIARSRMENIKAGLDQALRPDFVAWYNSERALIITIGTAPIQASSGK